MDPHGREPHQQPGVASAEQGTVLLDGPDGVAITLTPNAAEEMGRNLIAAADEARGHAAEQPPTLA